MTRLVRSGRISGRWTETRRCAPVAAFAAALAASIAALAIAGVSSFTPIGSVFAQTPGTSGPISLGDLFTAVDSVDLTADGIRTLREAAQKGQAQGQCPKGKLTIVVIKGDPLFQAALASARRDALARVLGDQARSYLMETDINGARNDVRMEYGTPPDQTPPRLTVEWTPPKGTKVKANQHITAKAVARDDANDWQTGVKTIDLTVEGGGLFGFEDFPQPPQTCERAPPPRTLDGVYTVPANPPAVVRLHAIAKDYAGNETDVWAEFPTGDWYGTFGWKHLCQGGGSRDETHGISELTLDYDGRGNLTGTLVGRVSERNMTMPVCSAYTLVTPGTFRAKLLGSYTPEPDRFSVQAVDVQTTPGRASLTCPAGGSTFEQPFFSVYEGPMFRDAFRDLRRQPDGAWKSSGEQTISMGGGTCTTTTSMTLHAAQN